MSKPATDFNTAKSTSSLTRRKLGDVVCRKHWPFWLMIAVHSKAAVQQTRLGIAAVPDRKLSAKRAGSSWEIEMIQKLNQSSLQPGLFHPKGLDIINPL
jgi:hypothetical protein